MSDKSVENCNFIPVKRINSIHISQLSSEYSTTPGGTAFSTTPGGTRIVYDRDFLLECQKLPLSQTPPANLPDIPGVTSHVDFHNQQNGNADLKSKEKDKANHNEDSVFEMDM